MKIQILGTGCAKCRQLAANAESAAEAAGLDYQIEKVEDLNQIMGFGVMMTPALAVDGEVKVSGKVPSVEQLVSLISGSD